jgi:N-acetylmuramoyl-L-alanine amidase
MVEEGFQPYLGLDYGALTDGGLYAADPSQEPVPGVFVDRHAPGQRIRLLRRPQIPSPIVETHEAHDRSEVLWWSEGATQEAFARAILRSIDDIHLGGTEVPPKDLPTGAE